MLEYITACPVCDASELEELLTTKDFTVSQAFFKIDRCKNCSFKFTNPRPLSNELASYYDSPNYISHTNNPNNFINKLYRLARYFTLRQKTAFIQKVNDGKVGRLLDIGCGTGEFLQKAVAAGWRGYGIEPEKKAREQIINTGKDSIHASLVDLKASSFDVITLWHVMEHLPDLKKDLAKIYEKLKPGGKLIIAVPNANAAEAKYYQEFWAAYDVPRHLYHFDIDSMSRLLQSSGFTISDINGMPLDAIYVAILSEKYKYRTNMLRGIFKGIQTNILGMKSKDKYSSLIFTATK